jgi:nitrate reductase alpha subunit
MHTADTIAQSARLGWMPFYPQFDRNPMDLADEALAANPDAPIDHVVQELVDGRVKFAVDDVDAPENWPRTLVLWRANLLGSSAKGNEYFLKYLLGTHSNVTATEPGPELRPSEVAWREDIPEGKLDLLVSADFRMTSTTLLSDIVFPAATWYEKHDLSTTDMHPFVHAFSPAIDPPWEAKSDFDTFHAIARKLSDMARTHLGTRKDLVSVPMLHDTPGETAQPGGHALDWAAGEVEAIPGKTMPALAIVERDYTAIADKLGAVGPLAERLGFPVKGVTYDVSHQVQQLAGLGGVMLGGGADGRPAIDTDTKLAEAILTFSGTTNGELAAQGFRTLETRVGKQLADLAEGSEEKRITFADTQARPVPVITSPEWSGSETGGRRYAPFTVNVERLKPWHTLTGRMHFFLDHDWMRDLGEALPTYRPPMDLHRLLGEPELGEDGSKQVTVRYLTPHSKWSIHSEYQDNLFMLSLSRGGPTVWMSPQDADVIEAKDNDWVECVNANGIMVLRAIVTHRMPPGVVFVYHAQERTIDVPKTERTGRRGGIHNSLTRLLVKPTHLIGGYAQLSYTFNYLGPTGNQRDMITTIRRRSQEVTY